MRFLQNTMKGYLIYICIYTYNIRIMSPSFGSKHRKFNVTYSAML